MTRNTKDLADLLLFCIILFAGMVFLSVGAGVAGNFFVFKVAAIVAFILLFVGIIVAILLSAGADL